jgi:hypothetical protein
MTTKAAELISAYGDISNAPGRRCQAQTINTLAGETSVGITGATTVEDAYDAIFDIVKADRTVTSNSIGRATSVEVIQGRILTGTLTSGGTLYDGGGTATFTGVSLTGGTGTGAVATVVVTAGVVTAVTITNGGSGYDVGEALSATVASLGNDGGSGFVYTVATTTGPINA